MSSQKSSGFALSEVLVPQLGVSDSKALCSYPMHKLLSEHSSYQVPTDYPGAQKRMDVTMN